MDLEIIEERARSIVAACATPGAGDIAIIQRNQTSVSVRIADERLDLDPTDPPLPVQFAFLKSRVASITRIQRVNAMLTAADISPGTFPLWTLCALRPITEWVAWAGVEKELFPHARWAQKDRKSKLVVADTVTVFAHVDSRNMALHAGLYGGALTGSLTLANMPRCYFTDRPHPHIVVEATTLPENSDRGHRGAFVVAQHSGAAQRCHRPPVSVGLRSAHQQCRQSRRGRRDWLRL